jgi:hypothetical protein
MEKVLREIRRNNLDESKLKRSTRKHKKYSYNGVHFGDKRYGDYVQGTATNEQRENYCKRSSKIVTKPLSANDLARRLLWKC